MNEVYADVSEKNVNQRNADTTLAVVYVESKSLFEFLEMSCALNQLGKETRYNKIFS